LNLAEAKKKALSLMAEYSVDGVLIGDDENADYLNRMNRFASDAQIEISNKLGIEAAYSFVQVADQSQGYNKYPLPTDYKEHLYMNCNDERFRDYRIENGNILISKVYDGAFELFYFKNPDELGPDTLDTYVFEIPIYSHSLLPYFMAGMAVQDEKSGISDRLLNLYYAKLDGVKPVQKEYQSTIQNVDGW
jgi:hypothetical protein